MNWDDSDIADDRSASADNRPPRPAAPPAREARNAAGEPGERRKAPALEILPALGRVSDITADNASIDRPDALQGSPHDIWSGVSATAQTPAGAMLAW